MTPLERRALGLPYVYNDPAIIDEQYAYQDELAKYNRTFPSEHEKRKQMLSAIMAEVGEDCTIDTPVHANWGLRHVHFGSHIYCNAMVSFVDDADIYVGDYCMIGLGRARYLQPQGIPPTYGFASRGMFIIYPYTSEIMSGLGPAFKSCLGSQLGITA